MKLKRLSEVSFIDQPSDGANVIIEDGGNLGKTTLSGGSDDQKWKEETSTPLFNESVTTVDQGDSYGAFLSYSEDIDSDTLTVTYDGVEYTCPKKYDGTGNSYGGSIDESTGSVDYSDFPFNIYSYVNESTGEIRNTVSTETAGEHTVVAVGKSITYTSAFAEGVKKNSAFIVHFSAANEGITSDKTVEEIADAYNKGFIIIGLYTRNGEYHDVYYLQDIHIETGAVSFVTFNISVIDSAVSKSINCIKSDDEDVNSFIMVDIPL